MIIGYLDNSQRNISTDDQRDIINEYAQDNVCAIDIFLTDSDIQNIKNDITSKENTIVIANIACLGSKLSIIVDNIESLILDGFTLITIKENLKFKDTEETKQLLNGIKLSIELRNSMISVVTRKALDIKRAQGFKLGRDFGYKHKRYCWEGKEEEIKNKLLQGITHKQIAEELEISYTSFYNFLRLNPELKKLTRRGKNA